MMHFYSNFDSTGYFPLSSLTGLSISFDNAFVSPMQYVEPGLHIVVIIGSTITRMFPTLSQAILIQVNTLIITLQASPAL